MMKLSTIIPRENLKHLKITDFDNLFNIYFDNNKKVYTFNLNATLYVDVSTMDLNAYVCTTSSYWPLISYQIYGTTRLAWLLLKLNNVQAKDIFLKKQPGDVIYYLPKEQLTAVIKLINRYE